MKTYMIYLITIIRIARYHLQLASSSTFMTDSQYLGTIYIWRNLNERHYYSTLSESVICRIDAKLFCIPVIGYTSFSHQARMHKTDLLQFKGTVIQII